MRIRAFLSLRAELWAFATILYLAATQTAACQTWTWTTETVDVAGAFTSIAADAHGNLHLSYIHPTDGLVYAYRAAHGSRWLKLPTKMGGTYTHLALDSSGYPQICTTYVGRMLYSKWDGHRWITQEIDPASGTPGFSCSVAVAPDGTPHVTWYQEIGPDGHNYLHFKYAILRNGTWVARTVDFCPQTGKWNWITLDGKGDPHVSYDCFVRGQMRYAEWDGNKWDISVIEDRDHAHIWNVGLGSSIVLDKDGNPRVAYYTNETSAGDRRVVAGELKYAVRDGTKWKIETVDTTTKAGGWAEFRTTLLLDRAGVPHIAYENEGAVKHAFWDGTQWQIQTISASGSDPTRFSSMTIDGENVLYLAYRDFDGKLKVATGRFSFPPSTTPNPSTTPSKDLQR